MQLLSAITEVDHLYNGSRKTLSDTEPPVRFLRSELLTPKHLLVSFGA